MAALGQKAHYVHDFDKYKVYLQFGATDHVSWLRTVKWKDHQCVNMHISPVDVRDDGSIEFHGGTVWEIYHTRKGLRVHMPATDTTVIYKHTEKTVRDLCAKKRGV